MKDRDYEFARNRNYDGLCNYRRALACMVYKSFDKKVGLGISVNEQIAEELHKPLIKKFKRRKVYARFKDNIWAADLAEMRSLFSRNKNVKFISRAIDVFTKYAWVKALNKLWIDHGRELCNKLRGHP